MSGISIKWNLRRFREMIFYFSATGNSKYVASRIAQETNDKIISITDCIQKDSYTHLIKEGEKIGVIAPTYFWGLPNLVSEFLDKLILELGSKPYIYYVSTYGTTTGQTGFFANQYFNKKGYSINAYFSVKMPDTWTPVFNLTNKEKMNRINEKAETRINEIIEKVKSEKTGDFMQNKVLKIAVNAYYPTYEKARETKHFTVEESCIGCHLCEKKCPVSAIKIENDKPIWIKDKCVLCLGCLHRCPKFSIQYGKNTKKHGQYVHPNTQI